jgi:hypothetical protein
MLAERAGITVAALSRMTSMQADAEASISGRWQISAETCSISHDSTVSRASPICSNDRPVSREAQSSTRVRAFMGVLPRIRWHGDTELPTDRSDQAWSDLAVARNGGNLVVWAAPLRVLRPADLMAAVIA